MPLVVSLLRSYVNWYVPLSVGPPGLAGAALGAGTDGLEASAGLVCESSGWKEYSTDQVAATAISTAQTSAVAHRVRDEYLCFIAATRPRAPRRRCVVTGAVTG